MRRFGLLLLALLLTVAASACAPATTAGPTAVGAFPTALISQSVGRVAQPTAVPSLTPLAISANAAAYGSVQVNAAGAIVPTTAAGANAPLFSAQAVDPAATMVTTPGATVVVVVTTPIVVAGTGSGDISVPPIATDTGGFIVGAINSLCIPVINFLLSITVGLVVAIWNAVGTQTNALGQVGLCILLPVLVGWYFLFRRRRRRR